VRQRCLPLSLLALLVLGACENDAPSPADAGVDLPSQVDGPLEADTTAPADASLPDAVPDAGARPFWLLHLADVHLGAQAFAVEALIAAQEVLATVEPAATLMTGDMSDHGATDEWSSYLGSIQGQVPAYPYYSEVIGNHDVKADDGASFLANTLTGMAGDGLYGLSDVDTPQGRIRIVRTNTVDTSVAASQLLGYVSETQLKDLQALPPSPVPLAHTVVTGHHPLKGVQSLQVLGTDGRMRQLFDHFSAEVYLCGHAHFGWLSWEKNTLVVQAPTLGKPEIFKPGLALVSLDATGPAARFFELSKSNPVTVSWPLVLVTTPADADLGGTNPHAKPLPPGQPLTVRALAFSPGPIMSVEARLDGGSWLAMNALDKWLWQIELTTPATAGVRALEVVAVSAEGVGQHTLHVVVGP
jgi:hypothetical protein